MNGTARNQQFKDGLLSAQDLPAKTPSAPEDEHKNEDLTTRVLRFLSTASPETLGGVAVGLAACTYLVLGRVGLVLIGGLGGVVLHATWERNCIPGGSVEHLRRESSLDIVKRLLDLRDAPFEDDKEDSKDQDAVLGSNFEGYQPETATALNELVEAIIRDYVKWWYQPMLPKDISFPAASRQTLTKFILSVSQHLSRKRPADTFLDFLTNSSSIVIVFLGELSSAMALAQGTNSQSAEAVYKYLSANPNSNLANILNERQQSKKFKMIADDILQNFLEKATYDCNPARIFLREVLSGLVLEMTLKSCSRPEWINGWIVYLLEEGEPDFSQAIDVGMGSSTAILGNPLYDLDGNVGNVAVAKSQRSEAERQNQESKGHKKRLSKAEEAMEEAMEEAKRLSRLIAEEDAMRAQPLQMPLEDAPKALIEAIDSNTPGLISTPLMSNSTSQPPLGVATSFAPFNTAPNQNIEDLLRSPELATPIHQSPERNLIHYPEESDIPLSPTGALNNSSFTNFDQIVSQSIPLALQDDSPSRRRKTVSLTLHNANILVHDDSSGSDKGRLRSKPNTDYLVQIEPASSEYPGWMIVRKYPDFETLHEVLRRIAQISGVTAFAEQHHNLPNWKEHTKASLRGELERYLRDACWYQPLAESEGMKRFLERDQSQSTSSSTTKNGFPGIGWPTPSAFETMGKGMLDVLTNAPKGVAEGGKAIGGGISGVLTNIGSLGQKKQINGNGTNNPGIYTAGRSSTTLPRMDSMNSIVSSRSGRVSEDSLRPSLVIHNQPSKLPSMERRPSYNSIAEDENEREPRLSTSARSSMSGRRSTTQSRDPSRTSSIRGTPISSPIQPNIDDIKLPPPPSAIADDYGSQTEESSAGISRAESIVPTAQASSTAPFQQLPGSSSHSAVRTNSIPVSTGSKMARQEPSPLTEAETRVAVELLFAVINEMYTLSSAWNIRRTLLTAAKTFLLRPGNPSLSSIQSLIQDSVITSNTSDAGIAAHIRNLRANTLPTEDELKAWPADSTSEEKERLRIKARRLLVERGVPTQLTGVMGQAATGEAMGKIFDCLQVEEVSRGLMFGLLLQAARAVTH